MPSRPLILLALAFWLFYPALAPACTIVSAVGADGEVWNVNNEDGPRGVANFLSVFPKTADGEYGYYTLSYLSAAAGNGASAQGGMNEAGLTFDFNAIDHVDAFDPASRQVFPEGNDAIFAHILGTMSTVDEVIAFFETYWFEGGFTSAQMHVADRSGRFAIVSPSGVKVAEPGQPLISTNYDLCGGGDGSQCWRYPVAEEKLATREVDLATMLSIALDTRQKESLTMYSNVQNLSTGDIWLLSYHDPDRLAHVNIADLLARGSHSYSFADLGAIENGFPAGGAQADVWGSEAPADSLAGTYWNDYATDITVAADAAGLRVGYANGVEEVLVAQPNGVYALPDGGEAIAFQREEDTGRWLLRLYLDEAWALTAQRKDE